MWRFEVLESNLPTWNCASRIKIVHKIFELSRFWDPQLVLLCLWLIQLLNNIAQQLSLGDWKYIPPTIFSLQWHIALTLQKIKLTASSYYWTNDSKDISKPATKKLSIPSSRFFHISSWALWPQPMYVQKL